jgi:hypothetical protein
MLVMKSNGEQFHVLDLASQASAVQAQLAGLSTEAKIQWLAARGSLELVPSRVSGGKDVYRFTSRLGFECAFFFDEDRLVFIGEHTTWTVP